MKYVIVTALLGSVLGLLLRHYIGGDAVGTSMALTLVGLPLLGLIVTVEDWWPFGDRGGGTGSTHWEDWVDLPARAAISGIGFGIDVGGRSPISAALLWTAGTLGLVASFLLHRRMDQRGRRAV
jgi:hypothetical protein